jgi:hypothetical protein
METTARASFEPRLRLVRVVSRRPSAVQAAAPVSRISQRVRASPGRLRCVRSRVSLFMNKFRKLGFIKYNGALEVHNSLLNVVLRDNPHIRRSANKDH